MTSDRKSIYPLFVLKDSIGVSIKMWTVFVQVCTPSLGWEQIKYYLLKLVVIAVLLSIISEIFVNN